MQFSEAPKIEQEAYQAHCENVQIPENEETWKDWILNLGFDDGRAGCNPEYFSSPVYMQGYSEGARETKLQRMLKRRLDGQKAQSNT